MPFPTSSFPTSSFPTSSFPTSSFPTSSFWTSPCWMLLFFPFLFFALFGFWTFCLFFPLPRAPRRLRRHLDFNDDFDPAGADDEADDEHDDEGDDVVVSVDVTVLYFAGCPSWHTALERVHAAAEQVDVVVSVSLMAVESQHEADRLGFTGSPTIWLDGADPFATADAAPALACRVYTTPHGLAGSPTVDQLADALAGRRV